MHLTSLLLLLMYMHMTCCDSCTCRLLLVVRGLTRAVAATVQPVLSCVIVCHVCAQRVRSKWTVSLLDLFCTALLLFDIVFRCRVFSLCITSWTEKVKVCDKLWVV